MSKYKGFSQVQLRKPQKSVFDLTHDKRITTRMGRLTPLQILEAIPGDTFRGSTEILIRTAPLLAPIYDQITLFTHHFFVPCRLLWEDWEEFITGGRLGVGIDPVNAPIPPYYDIGGVLDGVDAFSKSRLGDYLGVPDFAALPGYAGAASYIGLHLDAMPFLAYQKVYEDYYRDRNFVADNENWPYPSGEMAGFDELELRVRSYAHDYFTAALPFTQRGEEVLMPLAGTGSVNYLDETILRQREGAAPIGSDTTIMGRERDGQTWQLGNESDARFNIENIENIELTSSAVGINDFRSAYALQVWLEINAVGGSRYTESTQAHFGVRPQDDRLQRAEYLGGSRTQVRVSEIVSTAWSEVDGTISPLANMAGHGLGYSSAGNFRYFCPEHGFIITIGSIMAPATYDQGLPRMFRRRTFLDYPWPSFAKLGEQQVDAAELFADPVNLTEGTDGQLPLFGYQSRYADWKYMYNSNHGDFKDTLNFWSLTRKFQNTPILGEAFVQFDDGVQNKIFAVNDEGDNFWLYVHNKVTVKRSLPYFGTPNTLGFV